MSNANIVSIQSRIAALQVKLAAAIAAAENNITAEKLTEGTVIKFNAGKGDNKTVEQGTVLAVVVNEKGGTVVKVFVSAGANSRVASPFISQVISIVGDEPAAADEVSGDA